MSKFLENLEFDAPSHYASALINGDRSGMTDQEEREMDEWLARLERRYPGLGSCVDVSEKTWFGQWSFPEQGYLGTDLSTYTFHQHA